MVATLTFAKGTRMVSVSDRIYPNARTLSRYYSHDM